MLKKIVAQGFAPFHIDFMVGNVAKNVLTQNLSCQKWLGMLKRKNHLLFFIKEEKSFTSFNNHIDNRLIRISLENISLK